MGCAQCWHTVSIDAIACSADRQRIGVECSVTRHIGHLLLLVLPDERWEAKHVMQKR
jgi:hypothetical protein